MADPLSVAGSVVGLISLGIQVTKSLVDFYRSYKSRDAELSGITERLEDLEEVLQSLKKTISNRSFQAEEQGLVELIETSIKNCNESIQELDDECQKFRQTSSAEIKAIVQVAGRRATYPFRQSTLQKLDEDISEIRASLSLALETLQLNDTQALRDDVTEMKILLDSIRTDQILSHLSEWLKAPDAFIEHNAACDKKYPGTGMWFIKSPQFSKWLTRDNSILWLSGFAGSGKSVLCSTAIQSVLRNKRSNRRIGIAFFYFTFNNESKQNESAMVRALLLQLSSQLQNGHVDLKRLQESYKACIPPSPVLLEYLRRLIQRFESIHIFLDALDESPRTGPRGHVLDALETIRNWDIKYLHLFVSSRDEPDIRESLHLLAPQEVMMQNTGIDKDIANFVSGRLSGDRRLQRLLPYRDLIQETLARDARGVFRWAECQLRSLQSAPRSEDHLNKILHSLPQSLDETYERMLLNIESHSFEDARRILTLLCFAVRPLKVHELIDGIAVEVNGSIGLNRKRRLQDADDILHICPGLIDIGLDAGRKSQAYKGEEFMRTVRIAHFSVQEYLISDRIRRQKAAIFSLNSDEANAEIAQICLTYLLEHDLSHSILDLSLLEKFPLAQFAAEYWYHHYREAAESTPKLNSLILTLFQSRHSFVTSVKLCDRDSLSPQIPKFSLESDEIASPVYYASLLGLDQILPALITNGQGEPTKSAQSIASISLISSNVNAQGGSYCTALQAASCQGHHKVLEILLEKGAEINAQGGPYDNALQAASAQGYNKVVSTLLEKGAEINTQGGYHGNALQAASTQGHYKVVEILLEKGAEINARGGYFGYALQAASFQGHYKVVEILLDKGADINAQGGEFDNALQAASSEGHNDVVEILLDKGANINAQGGYYGNALQVASFHGHYKVVEILLDKGAKINTQGGHYGNALQAASTRDYKVVKILLDKGAKINAQGGFYGNALQAASFRGYEDVVEILLEHGATADLKDEQGRYPFHLACASGKMKSVKLLSSFTSDYTMVDAQGRNGLHHAASGGSTEVVQWLLKEGFRPSEADRDGWTPLHWAARNGSADTMTALKKSGASCTTERIEGWTPESVAVFHHNQFPSTLHNDADHEHTMSELVSRESHDHLAASTGSRKKGQKHDGIVCDGCMLDIYGTRYKCFDCPDFDFCFKCKNSSHASHPGHNFHVVKWSPSKSSLIPTQKNRIPATRKK